MEKITSLQNQKVKDWMNLYQKKFRDETGHFLIEGEQIIQEAHRAGIIETIIYVDENPFDTYPSIEVSEPVLKKLSRRDSGARIMAVCKMPQKEITSYNRLLLLDGIQDPGNLGTLIRSAISFEFDGIYLSEDCCDIYNEKVIRSTQGALFHLPIVRTDLSLLIDELKEKEVTIVGTSLESSIPLQSFQIQPQLALILGNEGSGVSQELLNKSDTNIRIEMKGFESLNVAVAGGIIMYHFQKI